MPLDPISLGLYVDLGIKITGLLEHVIHAARAQGATDEQLAEITADYDARIIRRLAELEQSPEEDG